MFNTEKGKSDTFYKIYLKHELLGELTIFFIIKFRLMPMTWFISTTYKRANLNYFKATHNSVHRPTSTIRSFPPNEIQPSSLL